MKNGKLPHLKTKLPGPKAQEILKLDERYISPSYTRSYPLVAKSGRGALVEDVDGNVFLDFSAGIAVVATGHCHPEVVAAIQKQAAELIHMSGTDFYYPQMIEVAQKLEKITPGDGPKRVFYGNSGTEAIEAAIKLARYHTRREKILAFWGCFHGRTYGALSLTASKPAQRKGFGPMLPGVIHVPYAYCYRCPYGLKRETCGLACARSIEENLFHTFVPAEEVAAIVVEPVQGEGGYIVPPAEFLQELERVARKYGIMFVVDEVQCGMGRTGKWWASEHFGITPDILCIAKGIASGMPLGITVARADIMEWKPGAHASTFGGNPVSLAAAMATIKLLEERYLENARVMGEYIFSRLADWPERHKLVGDVRGLGLMIGIELVRDKQTKEKAQEERDAVVRMAFERGLLVLGCGENTLRMMPPLVIDQEQAEFAVNTIDECLTELEKRL